MKKTLAAIGMILVSVVSYLAGVRHNNHADPNTTANARRQPLYYVDPMHRAYKSDKPGIAPDCGMQLEPVYADDLASQTMKESENPESAPLAAVEVSAEKRQLMGIRVAEVERAPASGALRTLGRVAFEETSVYRVAPPVDGLVRSAGNVVTGSFVAKDQVLAAFYNRDFLTAQQTYLYALNTMDRLKEQKEEGAEQLKATESQMRAAEENLEFLGMSETQIHEIAQTRQIARTIELRSPIAGLVVARNVFPGMRFERGAELFRIVAINQVWVLAELSENEAENLPAGSSARVTIPKLPRIYSGRVSQSLSEFDPASRTFKIRLEVDNPEYHLRPGMFVDVELPVRMPTGLSVPDDAVLNSGSQQHVFVDRGDGFFEPRVVETGRHFGDRVEIVKGLTAGERIVASGTFLIDSESRLKLTPVATPLAEPPPPPKTASRRPVAVPGK